jgi:hypothetical protein
LDILNDGLDSLILGLFKEIDGLGSRVFSFPLEILYEDNESNLLSTGLGSLDLDELDMIVVIDGLRLPKLGLGSLDLSLDGVRVDE